MEAKVSWQKDLIFIGTADSGYPVTMDSKSSPGTGVGPVEMVAIALAGCTAMDVISILAKKHEHVTSFEVKVKAERAIDYPKVISHAVLEYVIAGRNINEESLLRAIELSVTKYCPVHAMLEKAFPIDLNYSIYEDEVKGEKKLVKLGTYRH